MWERCRQVYSIVWLKVILVSRGQHIGLDDLQCAVHECFQLMYNASDLRLNPALEALASYSKLTSSS